MNSNYQVILENRLENVKWDSFAWGIASGMGKREAAIYAGFSENSAHVTATKLNRIPKIKKRIEELRKVVDSERVMSVEERRVRLSEIGRAKVVDFVNAEGEINLEAANNSAIAEINVEDWQSVGKMARSRAKKIKTHSPIQAIDMLNKMDNIYEPESKTVNYNDIKILVVYDDSDKRNNHQITETSP